MDAKTMFNLYVGFSAAKSFIVGGIIGDVVKFAIVEPAMLADNLTFITASTKTDKDNSRVLRFLFSRDVKKYVKENGIELCSKDYFLAIAKSICKTGSNQGDAFEKLVTEYYGQEWHRNNNEFWEKGDIAINGVEYQIKTHKASLISDKTLNNLLRV
jgi:hypothetical protein